MKEFFVAFVAFSLVNASLAGNLLFLNGMASPSHHIWNRALMEAMAKRGYNLTILSADIDKNPAPNMHYIHLENVYPTVQNGEDVIDLLEFANMPPFPALMAMKKYYEQNCEGILSSSGIEVILGYSSDFIFDGVVYDFTAGPCLLPLLYKFNFPPLIAVSAFSNPTYTDHVIGGQKYSAFVPHYLTTYLQDMNFMQRVYNFLLYTAESMIWEHLGIPSLERKSKKRFNFKDCPSLRELEEQTAIMLVNSDNAIDYPEPLQPNQIQVGGLQIQDTKELPEDIKLFIENATKGAVLMSLGTNIQSNMLPKDLIESFIKTFELFPDHNFLWKFESEESELPLKLSKNVMVKKFLPQNDILAHPNVKAFITHSGLLSTQESIWHGKPMVAIPFFVDQLRTAERSVNLGSAVKLHFQKLDVESFKNAIAIILNDPNYTKNVQNLSKLFRDKPTKPIETAVWWIQFVIRNPTTKHLKSPTLKLGRFKSRSYDVLLFFILMFLAIIIGILKIMKIFWCRSRLVDKKKIE